MLSKRIGVCAVEESAQSRADEMATRFNLPCVTDPHEVDIVIMVDVHRTWLRRMTKPIIEWFIDFLSPAYQEKRAKRTRKNDTLSRALGLHKNPQVRVLDMSAGLGKDAYWIAYCGASVTLIERNPILACLLEEAINALRQDPQEGSVGERMILKNVDAVSYLEAIQPGEFDVAYYDPMFMPRRKSALVKKDMQIMHDLIGAEPPSDLCDHVLNSIPCLVVKRAKADPPYHNKAHTEVSTGTVRYEIYRRI